MFDSLTREDASGSCRRQARQARREGSVWSRVVLGMTLCTAVGCSSGGGDAASTAPPLIAGPRATINNSQAAGVVGTDFQFSADVSALDVATLAFQWDFGDGQSSTASAPQVQYGAPGSYIVSLTVTDTNGESATTESLVTIFDPAAPTDLVGEPIPILRGDVDGNGVLELRDAQILRQHLAGLTDIQDASIADRADFDLDGELTELDSDLVSLAILEGGTMPRAVAPQAVSPGQVITLFSPALLDPAVRVEVDFGTGPILPPRSLLGQVSCFVPLDVLTPGVFTAITGTAQVDLLVDGALAERFDLSIGLPVPVPANAMTVVPGFFDDLASIRSAQRDAIVALAAANIGTDLGFVSNDGVVLGELLDQAASELALLEADLLEALQASSPFERNVALRVAWAGGLGNAIAAANAAAATLSVPAATASDLDPLCRIKLATDALAAGSDAAGTLCAALIGATIVAGAIPADGPLLDSAALFAAALACAKYSTIIEIPAFVADLLPQLGSSVLLEPDVTGLIPAGGSVNITPFVPLAGLANLCQVESSLAAGGAPGVNGFQQYIVAKLVRRVLKKAPVAQIYATVKKASKATADQLEMQIASAVNTIVSQTGLSGYLATLAGNLCAQLAIGSSRLQVDADLIATSLSPSIGTITPGIGDTPIVYTCPPDTANFPQAGVQLTGTLTLCFGNLSGQLTLACGEEKDVTITMGDNGNLTDDIYEILIDGQSVLTSNVPVVSTSTTVQLAAGTYQFQMKGLAAPDGVGTYFVMISGGTLTNGPPQVGTNLTAGTVFTWDLTVN